MAAFDTLESFARLLDFFDKEVRERRVHLDEEIQSIWNEYFRSDSPSVSRGVDSVLKAVLELNLKIITLVYENKLEIPPKRNEPDYEERKRQFDKQWRTAQNRLIKLQDRIMALRQNLGEEEDLQESLYLTREQQPSPAEPIKDSPPQPAAAEPSPDPEPEITAAEVAETEIIEDHDVERIEADEEGGDAIIVEEEEEERIEIGSSPEIEPEDEELETETLDGAEPVVTVEESGAGEELSVEEIEIDETSGEEEAEQEPAVEVEEAEYQEPGLDAADSDDEDAGDEPFGSMEELTLGEPDPSIQQTEESLGEPEEDEVPEDLENIFEEDFEVPEVPEVERSASAAESFEAAMDDFEGQQAGEPVETGESQETAESELADHPETDDDFILSESDHQALAEAGSILEGVSLDDEDEDSAETEVILEDEEPDEDRRDENEEAADSDEMTDEPGDESAGEFEDDGRPISVQIAEIQEKLAPYRRIYSDAGDLKIKTKTGEWTLSLPYFDVSPAEGRQGVLLDVENFIGLHNLALKGVQEVQDKLGEDDPKQIRSMLSRLQSYFQKLYANIHEVVGAPGERIFPYMGDDFDPDGIIMIETSISLDSWDSVEDLMEFKAVFDETIANPFREFIQKPENRLRYFKSIAGLGTFNE